MFATHLKNCCYVCRASAIFQVLFYFRVCYIYICSKSPKLKRTCPSRPPVHTHMKCGLNVQGTGFFRKAVCRATYTPCLACAVVFNSAHQEAPPEDTVIPLFYRTWPFSKTLVKQFWSQGVEITIHIFNQCWTLTFFHRGKAERVKRNHCWSERPPGYRWALEILYLYYV